MAHIINIRQLAINYLNFQVKILKGTNIILSKKMLCNICYITLNDNVKG